MHLLLFCFGSLLFVFLLCAFCFSMLFVARSFLVSLFFIRSDGSGSWKKDWYEE
jgi:hypothetical protein